MILRCDYDRGLPLRLYRNPAEIKSDIHKINEKIKETSEMLNIRSMLVDLLSDEKLGSPEQFIPTLEEAVYEAHEALSKMKSLEEELSGLKEELYEVRCLI